MRLPARTPTIGCCTWREIGPVGVEDEASRCAMEASDEIKEGGTEVMPTATPDPPETGGVEAMRTGKGGHRGVLVLWQERPQRKRVLEEARRFGENWIRKRFRTCRQGKPAALALRRRFRENRKRVCLRDETRSKLHEANHPEIGRGVVRRLRRVKPYDEP